MITNYTEEEQKDLAAQAEQARLTLAKASSEDEGPPPEAAPVEEVEILEALDQLLQQSETEEASSSETEAASSSVGCASNTFIGQQQADGSWKTVCKE